MWKTVLIYGLAMAAMVALLKFVQYKYLIQDLSIEVYIGVIAVLFVALGVWVGRRLTRPKVIRVGPEFTIDETALRRLEISSREYEVLQLIAEGLSNQEIADKLFVSTSTVKTHVSNLFSKLDARRRTQAIQRAKEFHIIP